MAPRKVKARLLHIIQLFLDGGADSYFDKQVALSEYMSIRRQDHSKQRKQQKSSVREKLERIYTPVELARVGLYKDDEDTGLPEKGKQISRRNTMQPISQTRTSSRQDWLFSWIWRE